MSSKWHLRKKEKEKSRNENEGTGFGAKFGATIPNLTFNIEISSYNPKLLRSPSIWHAYTQAHTHTHSQHTHQHTILHFCGQINTSINQISKSMWHTKSISQHQSSSQLTLQPPAWSEKLVSNAWNDLIDALHFISVIIIRKHYELHSYLLYAYRHTTLDICRKE